MCCVGERICKTRHSQYLLTVCSCQLAYVCFYMVLAVFGSPVAPYFGVGAQGTPALRPQFGPNVQPVAPFMVVGWNSS